MLTGASIGGDVRQARPVTADVVGSIEDEVLAEELDPCLTNVITARGKQSYPELMAPSIISIRPLPHSGSNSRA